MNDILFLVKKKFVFKFPLQVYYSLHLCDIYFLVRHFQAPKNPFTCCLYGYYISYILAFCFLGETTIEL